MVKRKKAIITQDNRVTDERDTLLRLERNCLASIMLLIQEKYPVKKLENGDYLYTYHYDDIKNEKVFLSDERLKECFGSQIKTAGKNITYIKSMLSGLVHKPCHIPLNDRPDNCEWIAVNWLNYAKRIEVGGVKGYEVEVSDQVIPYILKKRSEGKLTYFDIYALMDIKNRYAQRIYQKCCQFKAQGWFIMTEEQIREVFCVYKIDNETGEKVKSLYPNSSQFRKKVLDGPIAELKKNFTNGLSENYCEIKPLSYRHGTRRPDKWFFAIGYKGHTPDFTKWAEITGEEPVVQISSMFDDFSAKNNFETATNNPDLEMIMTLVKTYIKNDDNFVKQTKEAFLTKNADYIKKFSKKIQDRRKKYNSKKDNFSGLLRNIIKDDLLHIK